ncbi:P-loop containing nucleoside triphosphate hydrolase protein [Mycena floridula]|nr:P-loop containing nucleoside triphosphate hydrolase protein [Mycena floridula]
MFSGRKILRRSNTVGSNAPDSEPTQSSSSLTSSAEAANVITSDYARRCKELIQLDRDLHSLGADKDFDLPRITVIGGQSAGKSSLIEAVSGISVPRDSGTCTRCPMKVIMSTASDSWSCSISLRIQYDSEGNAIEPPECIDFGPKLTNKNQVEIWLRRAQAAILARHIPPREFYEKDATTLQNMAKTEIQMLQFSQNVVQVELEDPTATDLSFVDLPGLIQNADIDLIELVKQLVVDHITGENTIILVTVPMSDDMENQQGMVLARKEDPEGERTIGVLTKPDTLTAGATGARQKWKDIILDKEPKHRLAHGYYCVRLPDDAERSRGVSKAESQRLADDFFSNTTPWSQITDRRRFGIPGFVSDISKLLVARIEANLPKLRERVRRLLAETSDRLEELPPPPSLEPTSEVLLLVTKFTEAVKEAVMATNHKQMVQSNREHYESFKDDIRRTCPDFRPFEGYSKFPDPNLRDIDDIGSPEQRIPGHDADILDLFSVRERIRRSIGWELSKHVPFEATQSLVLDFTCKWREPSISCFDEVFATSSDFIEDLASKHFRQFKRLETLIWSLTRNEIESCRTDALSILDKILTLESYPLFTQNHHYLENSRVKWKAKYTEVRNQSIARENLLRSHPRLHLPEPFEEEIKLMSDVRAYFQVAYKRIIDYVPLLIEHQLNQALVARLPGMLIGNLTTGLNVNERMADLISEDPEIAEERRRLESKIARLREIQEKLNRIS